MTLFETSSKTAFLLYSNSAIYAQICPPLLVQTLAGAQVHELNAKQQTIPVPRAPHPAPGLQPTLPPAQPLEAHVFDKADAAGGATSPVIIGNATIVAKPTFLIASRLDSPESDDL